MIFEIALVFASIGCAQASWIDGAWLGKRQATATSASSTATPAYFQTVPELLAGPTPTGDAPFLPEYNPAPFPSVSYIPPQPLETQVPISGNTANNNIFQLFGQLSHYFANPTGFGANEYRLPAGANISAVYTLHRHGSRYPTTGSGAPTTGAKIINATGTFNATGSLAFLNTWKYQLGAEILVPIGKQELFDSGVSHYYNYGHLYPNNGSKIIVRSTTQDRMTQSAEYFLAGFFGLTWTQNATLELIIEQNGFNNSLAGYYDCPNNNNATLAYGNLALTQWSNIYLANATSRINSMISGKLNFTVSDVYNMQSLCAYETVALGYSPFCGLFTYDEWQGYEYSVDINFYGNNMFGGPSSRGTGIGWVLETVARIQHKFVSSAQGPLNYTLDSMASTFPTNQALNFDFTHDTNIAAILTAFGLTQFAPFLPATAIQNNRSLIVSHMEPFGARLDIEIIQAPKPVSASRNGTAATDYASGNATTYVHFLLNQRTIPLGASWSQCGNRTDGWCEMGAFLNTMSTKFTESQFQYACFGSYPNVTYSASGVTNGVPQVPQKK
ncbi:phosphoglycerate mutase-like protein [Microthyrium microscopicum]|uniref:3-phytase n=1 Tax=Microthyrium microscopicum TaxID=703497 RepID=A0A6A6U8M0_9PEZI|nr:phosphoglycerate mutase-like protein [Microthyrium microscopicum]